jgi:hypothetical protein
VTARYKECWTAYHQLRKRQGVTIDIAKTRLRNNNTIIGAMLLRLGYADGMICGLSGRFGHHLRQVDEIIGKAPGCTTMASDDPSCCFPGRSPCFSAIRTSTRIPDAEQLAEITLMAADAVRRFKIRPKVATALPFELRVITDGLGAQNGRGRGDRACPRRRIWKSTVKCMATVRSPKSIRQAVGSRSRRWSVRPTCW